MHIILWRNRFFMAAWLLFCFYPCLYCSSESDIGQISESLGDRLIDALDFEYGDVVPGKAPEASPSEEIPQIEQVNGNNLVLGKSFSFTLESSYDKAEDVVEAVVAVKGASKYIEVSGQLADYLFKLAGYLKNDRELKDKSFELLFALKNRDGIVGLYKSFRLEVTEEHIYLDGDEDIDGADNSDSEEETGFNVNLTWISIPAGTAMMGCVPQDTDCQGTEFSRHSINIPAFQLTRTEITQDQYFAVTGERPSQYSDCGGDCPVEQVNWSEAKSFCEKAGGRLPSESEWEYAVRAGTTTIYYCGDDINCLDSVAWWGDNSENTTHPVAVKDPNAFDLYDMHGNVLEWVEDCLHDDYTSAPSDGTVWVDDKCSTARVLRGGSWSATIESRALRSSGRGGDVPEIKNSAYGFRCARD